MNFYIVKRNNVWQYYRCVLAFRSMSMVSFSSLHWVDAGLCIHGPCLVLPSFHVENPGGLIGFSLFFSCFYTGKSTPSLFSWHLAQKGGGAGIHLYWLAMTSHGGYFGLVLPSFHMVCIFLIYTVPYGLQPL